MKSIGMLVGALLFISHAVYAEVPPEFKLNLNSLLSTSEIARQTYKFKVSGSKGSRIYCLILSRLLNQLNQEIFTYRCGIVSPLDQQYGDSTSGADQNNREAWLVGHMYPGSDSDPVPRFCPIFYRNVVLNRTTEEVDLFETDIQTKLHVAGFANQLLHFATRQLEFPKVQIAFPQAIRPVSAQEVNWDERSFPFESSTMISSEDKRRVQQLEDVIVQMRDLNGRLNGFIDQLKQKVALQAYEIGEQKRMNAEKDREIAQLKQALAQYQPQYQQHQPDYQLTFQVPYQFPLQESFHPVLSPFSNPPQSLTPAASQHQTQSDPFASVPSTPSTTANEIDGWLNIEGFSGDYWFKP